MHEISIMQAVLDQACAAAREHGLERITTLHLRIGVLSGVVQESLEFAFTALREETLAATAALVVELVPAVFRCTTCGREHRLVRFQFECPDCHGKLTLEGGGRGIELTRIEG